MDSLIGFNGILIGAINIFFELIYFVILIRIIISWLPIPRDGIFGSALNVVYMLTEPILGPIRSMIDKSPIGGGMMLDFSPVIALFIMNLIKRILIMLLI